MRRHPLGVNLQSRSNHWSNLADALSLPINEAALGNAIAAVDADLQKLPPSPATDLAPLIAFERGLFKGEGSAVAPLNLRDLSRARAMHAALVRARSKSGDPLKPLSPLRATLTCWNAARISRR